MKFYAIYTVALFALLFIVSALKVRDEVTLQPCYELNEVRIVDDRDYPDDCLEVWHRGSIIGYYCEVDDFGTYHFYER